MFSFQRYFLQNTQYILNAVYGFLLSYKLFYDLNFAYHAVWEAVLQFLKSHSCLHIIASKVYNNLVDMISQYVK